MTALQRVVGRPTWLLSRANARSQALLADAFWSEGLRVYPSRLLAALDQYGPSSQAELGRGTGIDRSDVVAALNDLVEGGLARREPDPVDGSRHVAAITRGALSPPERLDGAVNDVQAAVLAPLTPTE